MKQVTKFEAFDKKCFDSEEECLEHDLFVSFCADIKEGVITDISTKEKKVDGLKIFQWLRENKEFLREYLKEVI